MARTAKAEAASRARGAAKGKRRETARGGRWPVPVRRRPTLAERSDPFSLYERSVQRPEDDVAFFVDTFTHLRGREPVLLREDFCGTAKLSRTWCLSRPGRRAIGIDLDQRTLDWARQHNVEPYARALRGRMQLVHGNVLDVRTEAADVVCAMNFSFCVFKQRAQLARYLSAVRRGLARDGLLYLELYGGTGAIEPVVEEREVGRWTYVWEQKSYDPLTSETLCHIHFRFRDGSRLERAFTYDWRLWTIPELRELLLEAGFSGVRVYWATSDDDEDVAEGEPLYGNEAYVERTSAAQQYSWLVYVVGER